MRYKILMKRLGELAKIVLFDQAIALDHRGKQARGPSVSKLLPPPMDTRHPRGSRWWVDDLRREVGSNNEKDSRINGFEHLVRLQQILCSLLEKVSRARPYNKANIIKQTWSESSTSLRSRHIVDLALNESDRTARSSTSARIPSSAIPGHIHLRRLVAYSTVVYRRFEKLASKIPMSASTCENVVPDFKQPRNQAQVDSEWRVSTDVEECASGTEKLLMELEIN
ncbi:hypothetical protein EVAR_15096_1 [Eumeta japonica]|uniref:Uncharacterized protein n=1 Tax=Eumeta variegata TaxID=151549 RepID=A0A4C1UJL4_EUMVA|nr:hypothetical protein EVAR_15096_1 [Eumeta japonica]